MVLSKSPRFKTPPQLSIGIGSSSEFGPPPRVRFVLMSLQRWGYGGRGSFGLVEGHLLALWRGVCVMDTVPLQVALIPLSKGAVEVKRSWGVCLCFHPTSMQ